MITKLITILTKNKVINWFRKNYKIIAVIIISILTAFLFYLRKQLIQVNNLLDKVTNNYEYYMNLANQLSENNRTLLLTLDDFKLSNDSLIKQLRTEQKKLKLKDKEILQAQLLNTVVSHDTTIIVKTSNFNVEIKPNNLTSILINKTDSLLTHKIEIKNTQYLFINNKKVYKRLYKNWFARLLHLDFKKRTIYKYQITNSNDLIQVDLTRIINLSK